MTYPTFWITNSYDYWYNFERQLQGKFCYKLIPHFEKRIPTITDIILRDNFHIIYQQN